MSEEKKDIKVILNKYQLDALGTLLSGRNTAIFGFGGTGKTFLLRGFIKCARYEMNKNVLIVAPTGAAAEQIGGVTIHRAFGLPIGPALCKPKVPGSVREADIIIVDEISMVRLDLFDYIWRTIKEANRIRALLGGAPIQLVVCGDFSQLKPIIKEEHKEKEILITQYGEKAIKDGGFAFDADCWKEANFKCHMLREVRRQNDVRQAELINRLRCADKDALNELISMSASEPNPKSVYLVSRNADADRINSERLSALDGKTVTFRASIVNKKEIKNGDVVAREVLELKVGARVMCIVNDNDADKLRSRYQNGSLGYVKAIYEDTKRVEVEFDNGNDVILEEYQWEIKEYSKFSKNHELESKTVATFTQIPLILAYAQTIHKAQGQTYDYCVFVPPYGMEGQGYVAISRASDIRNCYFDLSNCFNMTPKFNETKSANDFYKRTFGYVM